jgi:hypothetical protein
MTSTDLQVKASALPAGAHAEKHVLPRGDGRLTLSDPGLLRGGWRFGGLDGQLGLRFFEVELRDGSQRP